MVWNMFSLRCIACFWNQCCHPHCNMQTFAVFSGLTDILHLGESRLIACFAKHLHISSVTMFDLVSHLRGGRAPVSLLDDSTLSSINLRFEVGSINILANLHNFEENCICWYCPILILMCICISSAVFKHDAYHASCTIGCT